MIEMAGYRFIRVFGPVIMHFLVINMVQMAGLHADAAFLTTVAAVIVLPFFFRALRKDEQGRNQGKRFRTLRFSGIAEIILLALGSNFVLTFLLNLLEGAFPFSNETQETLLESNLAVQIIGLGFLVPVMEEVLFRGLVYQRLKDYNKGCLSVFLAAVIFAVYHGNAIQILFAFPMGCILILVYERWKTIKAPVLFHITVNLSSVLVTAWIG